MTIVKFPYIASRRIFSRRPRVSKNGTPEERAAKAAAEAAAASTNGTVCMLPSPAQHLMSDEEMRAQYEALSPEKKASLSRLILALERETRRA